MASLKDQDAYKFYLVISPDTPERSVLVLPKDVLFQTTNKLKHHIIKKHFEEGDLMLGGKGGRTSATAAIKAIKDFYQPLQTRYEAEHADDIVHRPKLPLKRDNTVNMTQMRELLKNIGKTGACECCKAEKAAKFCGHESRRSKCDFFDLFSETEEEGEDEA
ncbi:hypothetical protein N7448_008876 [Penicillium atrosanguineum]|nr:hypothetical protein N7448_008876 [Penicillium atrosanguineum]